MVYQDKLPLDELMHYGKGHLDGGHSGRYPWGSGKESYQHSGDFLSRVDTLKRAGKSESEIADIMGIVNEKGQPSSTRLRIQISLANSEQRTVLQKRAQDMRDSGMSLNAIAKEMGFKNDSSVRSLLNENSKDNMEKAKKTADFLKNEVDKYGMIDVGAGIERELGVSKEKLGQALYILELQGYPNYGGGVPQPTNPGQQTNIKVLCKPGTEHREIYNYDKVHYITDYTSDDNGETFRKTFVYPESLDSKRLYIRYADEKDSYGHAGVEKDGVMEIRRGVKDLDLGDSRYAQVRIMVDGTNYLKGMAMYSDDIPDGYDIVFNTNKKKGTPIFKSDDPNQETVLKKIKKDPENPFGSLIKENGQSYWEDERGEKHLSLINKTREEGEWEKWSKSLPSQFLSKQSKSLIDKQLKLSIDDKQAEFDEIMSLTNPTIKKHRLREFAETCDSTAADLSAASLPRQQYHVILPVNALSENEVYAPNYHDGEKVALVRFPHAGTFEIPVLTVNNKNANAKKLLGNVADAVGINSKVAEQLSGADFDGDTVMVIPCNSPRSKVRITAKPALKDLEGFNNREEYAYKPGIRLMTKQEVGKQMGQISNLITDMTLKGADEHEIARAVKHSMVIIDAEKHKLDYKRSEIENGIPELRKKYMGHYKEDGRYSEGASSIISRAGAETTITKKRGSPMIDKETGKVTYKEANEFYIDKNGKRVQRMQSSNQMSDTDDAFKLVSDFRSPKEIAYAEYANKLKAMGNEARKEMVNTKDRKRDPSAAKVYQSEVDSLMAKLNVSLKNQPKERQATLIANTKIKAIKDMYPDLSKADLKKEKNKAMVAARAKVGARRTPIVITDKEWEAIQAGAISANKLSQMLTYADKDRLYELSMPKTSKTLSTAKVNKMESMHSCGYTIKEIAEAMGVSTSTVSNYLKGRG